MNQTIFEDLQQATHDLLGISLNELRFLQDAQYQTMMLDRLEALGPLQTVVLCFEIRQMLGRLIHPTDCDLPLPPQSYTWQACIADTLSV